MKKKIFDHENNIEICVHCALTSKVETNELALFRWATYLSSEGIFTSRRII